MSSLRFPAVGYEFNRLIVAATCWYNAVSVIYLLLFDSGRGLVFGRRGG